MTGEIREAPGVGYAAEEGDVRIGHAPEQHQNGGDSGEQDAFQDAEQQDPREGHRIFCSWRALRSFDLALEIIEFQNSKFILRTPAL